LLIGLFFLLTTVHAFASEVKTVDASQIEVKLAVAYVKGKVSLLPAKPLATMKTGSRRAKNII
jgi:hypothetical protein